MNNRRRLSDRRTGRERRRLMAPLEPARTPAWEEQRAQHITRYLFWAMALMYFNFGEAPRENVWFNQAAVNIGFLLYGAIITASMLHARRRLFSPLRWRIAMAIDMVTTSFAILADPLILSPGFLAFLMVILGNGMRYGLRFFAEAVIGSLICIVSVLGLRLPEYLNAISFNAAFFGLFFVIVVLYSYSLMTRVELRKQRLEAERNRDELTGLLNRRALFERVAPLFDERVARAPSVVLFADLDGFKKINDTHGHHVGDRVLSGVGKTIANVVRSSDLAARYGGDEFVLVLPGTDLSGGTHVARRFQEALSDWSYSNDIALSVSIGLGQIPDHGRDLKAVIERVDFAMYQGKVTGAGGGIRTVEPALSSA